MDKTQLQQKISEYFAKLPKDAQDIFSSMKWVDSVSEVATKYNLTDKQKEDLATETSLALLGIIHLDQYEESMINEIGIKKETADMIITELDKSIFSPIRSSLSNAFADNIEKIAEEKYGNIEKLDERFANLAPEVREAILNSQYQKNLYTIAGKYSLKMDEMGTLDEVTTKVMLGIISNEEYGTELSKNIKIPEDKMLALVSDVNDMVFKNIRSFLVKNTEIKTEDTKTEENTVPIPPYKRVDPSIPKNLPIVEDKVANEKEMENSGVEILQDKPTEKPQEEKVTMREDSIMVKSGVSVMPDIQPQKENHILPNTETQKSVLYGIENPSSIKNIMEMKLGSTTNKNTTTSVHTISSNPIDTTKQGSVIHDPYHEQI
jgi:hypothetical protein